MTDINQLRKTKIVCTIGPATSSPDMLRQLIEAGMNVARLNMSHGNHEQHGRTIQEIRKASHDLNQCIGILADLAGPKIRLGDLPVPERILESGEQLFMVSGSIGKGDELPVNYPYLLEDVKVGDRILLADGKVELEVLKQRDSGFECRVIVGGILTSRKGMNLPSTKLRIATFTKKDRVDLKFGLDAGIDFVAMSFVRHEKDFEPIKQMFEELSRAPFLIAKIEKPEALFRLDQILSAVDGVMLARGDLGVEMPLEQVPLIQKRVIKEARIRGKVVITATQMLGSMVSSPRPSRAEVTDTANAVIDGTDAVMLSDETAVGSYPVEAVRVLDRVCRATEPNLDHQRYLADGPSDLIPSTAAAISHSAVRLARDLRPAAIVAATTSGSTARLISRYRPNTPVVGLSPDSCTLRQLCLSWGVVPEYMPDCETVDDMLEFVGQWSKDRNLAAQGDCIVLVAGLPMRVSGSTNMLKVIDLVDGD